MAQQIWSQDVFSKGEISPLMYARVSVSPYYNGLKTASNVICFPQGAAGKRFGTYYLNSISGVTDTTEIFFESFQYLNECVYLMTFTPNTLTVYLEGEIAATISAPFSSSEIILMQYTILDNIFRITTGLLTPYDVERGPDSPNQILNFSTDEDYIVLNPSYYTTNQILPVRFSYDTGTMGNSLFTTFPQVLTNRTYFLKFLTPTIAQIYLSAIEAKAGTNGIVVLSSGVGNQFANIQNTWTINPTAITNYPTYDFGAINYSTYTFTPSATSGNAVNITCNTAIFTSANIGGTFSGNGGVARILSITSPTVAVVATIGTTAFADTSAILGINAILTEPAWSNTRGWPRVCSSFQNRAIFANTDLLPNGLWCSVINDFFNWDDSQNDDDNAISWYPTSGDINYIRFIVPYRSLTIHTNSGVMSTPLSVETAITPLNFSLTLQDSTPAEAVQPRGIDNQIVILSGNDAHSLLWDGFNNAYQSNIISVANEQLIRDPVDETAFVDLTRAGSRYMLIVNADGSLAIYQTLISEDVQGFTPAYLTQPYGNAYFRHVATSTDGRGWFVTERQIATEDSPEPITTYTQYTLGTGIPFQLLNGQNFLLLDGSNLDLLANDFIFPIGVPTAFQFANTGTLPTSNPQVEVGVWYWAVATTNLDFMVYTSIANAEANLDPIEFFDAGTGAEVIPWNLVTNFFIEELSFSAKVDCALTYTGSPTSILPDPLGLFSAQDIKIQGNGYGFDYTGINNTVETIAHGVPQAVSIAQYGFPIEWEVQPLPLSIFLGNPKASNLLVPKHIRDIELYFADTIGGLVNGIPIALQNFDEVPIGSPPEPVNGIMQYGIMQGWDDFIELGLTITHNEPFDIKLIGLFYKVDI